MPSSEPGDAEEDAGEDGASSGAKRSKKKGKKKEDPKEQEDAEEEGGTKRSKKKAGKEASPRRRGSGTADNDDAKDDDDGKEDDGAGEAEEEEKEVKKKEDKKPKKEGKKEGKKEEKKEKPKPPPEPKAPAIVRDDSLLVRVCSWNVGEANPTETGRTMLRLWLFGAGDMPSGKPQKWSSRKLCEPDLICIGLQEVDMSPLALLLGCCRCGTGNGRKWVQRFDEVCRTEGYEMLSQVQLVGMQILLFGKTDVLKGRMMRDCVARTTATCGLCGGLAGNKGATCARVALRVDGGQRTFCFINAHLAAKAAKCERRNQDHDVVRDRARFPSQPCRHCAVLDHDYVFWFGDLNYRLDMPAAEVGNLTREEIKEKLKNLALAPDADPPALLDHYDQLCRERQKGRVFQGFHEPRVSWAPTYKVLKGLGSFDMKRQPSYCDRVLYYAKAEPAPTFSPRRGKGNSGSSGGSGSDRLDTPLICEEDADEGAEMEELLPDGGSPGRKPGGGAASQSTVQATAPEPILARYSTREEIAARAERWSDCAITCLEYTALNEAEGSDHRPVFGLFSVRGGLQRADRGGGGGRGGRGGTPADDDIGE